MKRTRGNFVRRPADLRSAPFISQSSIARGLARIRPVDCVSLEDVCNFRKRPVYSKRLRKIWSANAQENCATLYRRSKRRKYRRSSFANDFISGRTSVFSFGEKLFVGIAAFGRKLVLGTVVDRLIVLDMFLFVSRRETSLKRGMSVSIFCFHGWRPLYYSVSRKT